MTATQSITPDAPRAVSLTPGEKTDGVYRARNLRNALEALHQDGLVVLKDVINVDHIDSLNKAMCEDAKRMAEDPEKRYNHNNRGLFVNGGPAEDTLSRGS